MKKTVIKMFGRLLICLFVPICLPGNGFTAVSGITPLVRDGMEMPAVRKLLKHFNNSAISLTVEREFPLSQEVKDQLVPAGTNPYLILGMMPAARQDEIER